MADSRHGPDHKIIRELVRHFATLRTESTYAADDDCEWKDGKCVQKSGKNVIKVSVWRLRLP